MALFSPGGTSYLAQHLAGRGHPHNGSPHHHQQQQGVLMTKEGYLRHLEAQLERVNDACDATAHVQRQQEELDRKLAALRELESQKAAAWVGLEQARKRDAEALQEMNRRVEGVEKLSDRCVLVCALSISFKNRRAGPSSSFTLARIARLAALQQQREPALALADAVATLQGKLQAAEVSGDEWLRYDHDLMTE